MEFLRKIWDPAPKLQKLHPQKFFLRARLRRAHMAARAGLHRVIIGPCSNSYFANSFLSSKYDLWFLIKFLGVAKFWYANRVFWGVLLSTFGSLLGVRHENRPFCRKTSQKRNFCVENTPPISVVFRQKTSRKSVFCRNGTQVGRLSYTRCFWSNFQITIGWWSDGWCFSIKKIPFRRGRAH